MFEKFTNMVALEDNNIHEGNLEEASENFGIVPKNQEVLNDFSSKKARKLNFNYTNLYLHLQSLCLISNL